MASAVLSAGGIWGYGELAHMSKQGHSTDLSPIAVSERLAADNAAQASSGPERPILFRDLAPALEFACWVVVALAPFLRWVNGAAVTDDQFVIQMTLVTIAVMGALGLRLYNWRAARKRDHETLSSQSQHE